MKNVLTTILLIVFFLPFYQSFAQKCKPDAQSTDKFTKKQNTYWIEEIYKPGFADGVNDALANNTSSYTISLLIGRFGDANFIQIVIKKNEASLQSANFESALKSEKGNEFLLGFQEGDPMNFIATGAQNNTKMDNINNVLVTTVSLDCKISDEDLSKLEQLTTKPITAIRIKLANGVTIEQDVKSKKGQNTMQKLACCYKFFKDNGFIK